VLPYRQREIERIYLLARDCAPAERNSFLAESCGCDPSSERKWSDSLLTGEAPSRNADPRLESLHSDACFTSLLSRMHLARCSTETYRRLQFVMTLSVGMSEPTDVNTRKRWPSGETS